MSEKRILESMKAAVRAALGKDTPVNPDSKLRQDLHLNSLDTLTMIMALEKNLGVRIDLLEFFERRAQEGLWGTSEIAVKDLIQFIMTI